MASLVYQAYPTRAKEGNVRGYHNEEPSLKVTGPRYCNDGQQSPTLQVRPPECLIIGPIMPILRKVVRLWFRIAEALVLWAEDKRSAASNLEQVPRETDP